MRSNFSALCNQWWQKTIITRHGRLAIIVIAVSILIVVWVIVVFRPMQARIRGLEYSLNDLHQEVIVLASGLDKRKLVRDLHSTQEHLEDYKKISTSFQGAAIVTCLLDCMKHANLSLISYTSQESNNKKWYVSERIAFHCSGTMQSMLDFLQELRKLPVHSSCSLLEVVHLEDSAHAFKGVLRFVRVL